MNEQNDLHWFKSTDSGDHGCVEVAFGEADVYVRDSKDRKKPAHIYTRPEWYAFLSGAKRGEFDPPQG